MLRFRFPIVIIDEDYRSENTSGLGIRALAEAIEKEGLDFALPFVEEAMAGGRCKPEDVFGVIDHWVTKTERVRVSDIERTVIDGLKQPEYCGGFSEVAKGYWMRRDAISSNRLRYWGAIRSMQKRSVPALSVSGSPVGCESRRARAAPMSPGRRDDKMSP